MARDVRILVRPHSSWLAEAVRLGGAVPVTDGPADAIVWTDPRDPDGLRAVLEADPAISWVQLPWAGIEPYQHVLDADRRWTCGKGVYADPVAEHALTLALAGLRGLGRYGRARSWTGPQGTNLLAGRAVVVGGGGIAESLLALLRPFGCQITVVRRSPAPMEGADAVVSTAELDDVLPGATVVFLALALTPETAGLFDDHRLRLIGPDGWIVNVARGAHIVTDDLVTVLADGALGGAALDVTDPEPLPDGHPLWTEERCIITPHVGNTPEMARPLLGARVTENVRRFVSGEPLIGPVDVDAGY